MINKIPEKAKLYHTQGFSVVSVKGKQPLIDWAKWQSQPQTREEFESLPWNKADGFALLCGTQNNDGLYLGVVDFDVKNLSEDVIEKGRQVLKYLPTTQTEETPSGGLHLIYLSSKKPKTISSYHNICALELLGENKLCIMAPSRGYRNMNDNPPTVLENLEFTFFQALEKAGIKLFETKKKPKAWFNVEGLKEGYKGEHPPCIFELLKGVDEGLRNNVAIRLSSYFVNFRRLEPEKAFKKLKKWNKLNNPPLSERELRSVFESALRNKYVFGCNDELLQKFCDKKLCPLKKTEEEKEPVKFSEIAEAKIQIELNKVLEAENQLKALEPHLDNIIVGETENKKATFVLLAGSKYNNPKKKQIILFKGTEGCGKSTLARELTTAYKVKEVGRFSAHALDYTNLEGYDVLLLKELGAMDMEKQGVSTLKFLSADDSGYTVEITVRDENTGRFTTEQHKIPCITVVSTTTRLVLDPQFERRAWLFNVDESVEQTKRVLKWKAMQKRQEDEKVLGVREITDYELSREVLKRFVEQLEPKKIIIPFRETLNDVLETTVSRIRSDIDKLHTFIELYALFNLKRLQKLNDDVYAVTPEVCLEALKIIIRPLTNMLAKVDERTKTLLNILKSEDYSKGDVINKSDRDKIAVKIGKSDHTVLAYLNFLEHAGFVSSSEKKPKSFTLLYSPEEIEEKLTGLRSKIESEHDLIIKMQKEAQKWFNSISEIQTLRKKGKILTLKTEPEKSEVEIQHEKNMPFQKNQISNTELTVFQGFLEKRNSEDVQNEKLNIPQEETWILKREGDKLTVKTGETVFQCPICKRRGKNMIFSSKHDLDSHILRVHKNMEAE